METTTITCDKCKEEIKDDHYFQVEKVDIMGWVSVSWPHPDGFCPQHVCKRCIKTLKKTKNEV